MTGRPRAALLALIVATVGAALVGCGQPAADSSWLEAPGARFRWPAGWHQEAPASSMRLAQARIDGDAGPGQLTAFFFGPGGGGSVEDNLRRWAGQVQTTSEPMRGQFEAGSFQVSWLDVTGTLLPSTMGTGPREPQPGSRLLGAVVEGPGGPWFFKITGPDATLDAARDDFRALLSSVEPSS